MLHIFDASQVAKKTSLLLKNSRESKYEGIIPQICYWLATYESYPWCRWKGILFQLLLQFLRSLPRSVMLPYQSFLCHAANVLISEIWYFTILSPSSEKPGLCTLPIFVLYLQVQVYFSAKWSILAKNHSTHVVLFVAWTFFIHMNKTIYYFISKNTLLISGLN